MTTVAPTTTTPTTSTSTYTSSTSSTTPANQEMNSQMFLQLLVAQLRSQDPSSPMDSNAMIGQMSQLASMEQLTSLNSSQTESFALQMRMAAAELVGKQITYTDSSGATQTGVASAVSYAGSVPMVTVGGDSVSLDAVAGVTSTTGSATTAS